MSQHPLLLRSQLLLEQGRYELAEQQLRQLLTAEPDLAIAHSLLGLCLSSNRDNLIQATEEAELGVHLDPTDPRAHYFLAFILQKRNQNVRALQVIEEAINLEPENVNYHGLKALLFSKESKWSDCLASAELGLSFDPEDQQCMGLRVLSLERLGRVSHALEEAKRQVASDPDSSDAHSSQGWALLTKGDYKGAQISFREALRLDPSCEFSRMGMVQALNSSNIIFRWMFRLQNSIGRLSPQWQWGLVIGLWLVIKLLDDFSRTNPAIKPYVLPITVAYMLFAMLSWIVDPLFNTVLRFHPFGKHLLSPKEKLASNLIAIVLGTTFSLALVAGILFGSFAVGLSVGLFSISLVVPTIVAVETKVLWAKIIACVAAAGFIGLFLLIVGLLLFGIWVPGLTTLFSYGLMIYCFAGQFLMMQREKL